jgi:hypothetical protein
MARVFTGRVVIPGNKINEYFEALQRAEAARAPFRESLEGTSINSLRVVLE